MKLWPYFLALTLPAASVRIGDRSLLNGSFEAGHGPAPAGWTVLSGTVASDHQIAHEGKVSLRMDAPDYTETRVESPPIQLEIGRRYEVRAWVRSAQLRVRDTGGRTPIAVGATLSMASVPFDYHSESVAGDHDWTPLRLRFVATRNQDRIVLAAGLGGAARGKAWFDSVSIDEVSDDNEWPVRAAIQTYGPAYRYPSGGWIYLHIEGEAYERGYQHGYLMAKEIPGYLDRCAFRLNPKDKENGWATGRRTVNALFLRGFDQEILQELKGIADGATAHGAKWGHRSIDLLDVAAMNTLVELETLNEALPVTPTGLEGLELKRPGYADVPVTGRCSAFAATGRATREGKMVIGHITMWPLVLAEQTNVMLDVKPVSGHRVMMQSYPGGIQSGTDYYQNEAGIVLTETTLRQSPFNAEGTPVAFRARKAIQYGSSVDEVVQYLGTKNNGLYTNEWLIGDARTNQIAMFELGTHQTRLYSSAKNDWFAGTEGFYWGCNNAKDLNVRLEYAPDPAGKPEHLPFVPQARDIKWQELYQEHKGKIDEQFAFLAFRTPPLVSASSMDSKVTTAEMASHLMCWALFGKPNQREWTPSKWETEHYPQITGLYSSGYRLFSGAPPAALHTPPPDSPGGTPQSARQVSYKDRLWQGWILPASDADLWLSAGAAAYHRTLRGDDWEKDLDAHRAAYRAAALIEDVPLSKLAASPVDRNWFSLAEHKGALLLEALRQEMTDERFFPFLRDFFAANTTRRVTTAQFIAAAEKAQGSPLGEFFAQWLNKPGLAEKPAGPAYLASHLMERLASTVIVYGTVSEAGANRWAAELLRRRFLDHYEGQTALLKDFELTDEILRAYDVVFVGRPETNSALAALRSRIDLDWEGALFRIDGAEHASEHEALLLAAANPLDRTRMVVTAAGNSALETVRLASAAFDHYEYQIFDAGTRSAFGFRK